MQLDMTITNLSSMETSTSEPSIRCPDYIKVNSIKLSPVFQVYQTVKVIASQIPIKIGAVKRIALLIILLLTLQCNTDKQKKVIGISLLASDPPTELCKDGFIKALNDRGFYDKQNISILEKNASGDFAAITGINRKFVELKTDIIVALSTVSLQSLIEEKVTIPVLFTSVANPFIIGAGVSDSMHHPLITGVPSTAPIEQTIHIIKELFPNIKVIGTLYTPSEPNSVYYANVQREEAMKHGILSIQYPVNDYDEISKGIDSLFSGGAKVIYQISDVFTASVFDSIISLATKKRIPVICNQIVQVNAGALVGLCLDFYKMGYETGLIASDILENKTTTNIPFKRMDRMILSVNQKAADNLGIIISDEFMKKSRSISFQFSDGSW